MDFIRANLLYFRIGAYLVLAGALFFAGWHVQGWRMDKEIAALKLEASQAATKASEQARAKEQTWKFQLSEAQNEAVQRETKLRGDAATARAAADSLRHDLAAIRQLPGDTSPASSDRTGIITDLFSECIGQYQGLAETADRLASDRQTLMDAWPK